MEKRLPDVEVLQWNYFIDSILGAGGFGITYKAFNAEDNFECAIKEYMPEAIASRNPDTGEIEPFPEREKAFLHGKKRFLEEAEILGKMNNIPGVVHVKESFEENNTAYYVMEYLEGKTLKQVMRAMGGKLPYPTAVEAIIKAGKALDQVHREAGIFHRDISPENIMILPDGNVKIIDFGSAKAMAVKENQQFSVVLKPGFAPPEQYASNLSQGSFTDVYALAGTFYYIVSGKMIPAAPDRIMGETYKSLHEIAPECPKSVSDAVDQALLMDARYRTQTAAEFVKAVAAGGYAGTGAGQPGKDKCTENVGRSEKINQDENRVVKTQPQEMYISPQADLPKACLQVVQGAKSCKGKIFPVAENRTVTVGRVAAKSEIVLEGHPEISGLHFKLMYAEAKHCFYVIDQSSNGLYYQNIRLEKGKKYKVMPGDRLGVGSMNCVISLEEICNEG